MRTEIVRLDNLEALELHADPNRSYERPIKVPDNPVNDAADVADHAQRELQTWSITGVISSVGLLGAEDPEDDPIRAAEDFFDAAVGVELKLVIPRRGEFSPVLLADYSSVDPQTEVAEYSLEFREFRVATSQTVEIPPPKTPEPDLASEEDGGQQSTSDRKRAAQDKSEAPEGVPDDEYDDSKGEQTDKEAADSSLGVKGLQYLGAIE